MRHSDALPTLLRQLKNISSRAAAAEALSEIGDKQAVPELFDALESSNHIFTKIEILSALGSLGSKEDIPILEKFLKPRLAGDIFDLPRYVKKAIAQIEMRERQP
jgi:HEAT repeat protein